MTRQLQHEVTRHCRLWCSTRLDSRGRHIKGQFGHCGPGCRPDPVCSTLAVTDTDGDFATGEYTASSLHQGRPLYINQEKRFIIFWISVEAGWGLGYEDGIETGGAVYSSGPSRDLPHNEPWLGAWRDPELVVRCGGGGAGLQLPRYSQLPRAALIHEAGRECGAGARCLARAQCPAVAAQYEQLTSMDRDSPATAALLQSIRDKVRDRVEKLNILNCISGL